MKGKMRFLAVVVALVMSVMMFGCDSKIGQADIDTVTTAMETVTNSKSLDYTFTMTTKSTGMDISTVSNVKYLSSDTETIMYSKSTVPVMGEIESYFYNGYFYSVNNNKVISATLISVDAAFDKIGSIDLDLSEFQFELISKKTEKGIITYVVKLPDEALEDMAGDATISGGELANTTVTISINEKTKLLDEMKVSMSVKILMATTEMGISIKYNAYGDDVKIDIPQFIKDYEV